VTWLSDATLDRLREASDWPDLSGTRYEALGVLGRGGMSTVYRAHDRELDREVALKVVGAGPAGDGTVARLRNEARVLARLEHPGLVPVHDIGTLSDGRLFYVMRLVRGRRLDEHARQERSLPALLRLFERVCEAVAFAHAQGVLHRDLKPANVMVGPFGEVLVLDWGLATRVGEPLADPALREGTAGGEPAPPPVALADAPTRTQRGTVLGTPGYMAPEQARGEVDRLDQRADVFALGAMLRFLLGAREEPVPRPLQAIARKASAPDPAERYVSVSALAADVSRFLSAERVEAHTERLHERVGRVIHKHRLPVALVAGYLLARVLAAMFLRI
jgi:serine/threonine protein kinase